MMSATLPAVVLLSLCASLVDAVAMTFEDRDPSSGAPVKCDRCPPGTYLRSSCSSTKKSDCSPCPPGSFTELWNHIPKCLRCGVCSRNEVVKSPCAADRDCRCQCKPGYYYRRDYETCVRHSECPAGQGVQIAGTPDTNTVCQICSNNTYSDASSAHLTCMEHKSCSCAGLRLALRGSSWHNSVCANCRELKDGADYLREILPAFFVHHNMNIRRLRRLMHRLPYHDGKTMGRTSELSSSEIHARLNEWIASATAEEIRALPATLERIGVSSIGERLRNKLQRIDSELEEVCQLGNEVDTM